MCGGPPGWWPFWGKADDCYAMHADGLRMAGLFESCQYDAVHVFYSARMARYYNHAFHSVEGVNGRNWLYKANGEAWTSELGDDEILFPSSARTLAALRQIPLNNGDRVVIFITSHGGVGYFTDPTGAWITYADVLRVFTNRQFQGEMLWIVDACFSGSIISTCDGDFSNAKDSGLYCQIITSTDSKSESLNHFLSNVPAQNGPRCVATSGLFRHRLMLRIDQEWPHVASGTATWARIIQSLDMRQPLRNRAGLLWPMMCQYRSFGSNLLSVSDWLGDQPLETVLLSWNSQQDPHLETKREVPTLEKWKYGSFISLGSGNVWGRKLAEAEHRAFGSLMRGVHKDLGLTIRKDRAVKLTPGQNEALLKVVGRVLGLLGLRGGRFMPNWEIVQNLVESAGGDASTILSSIDKVAHARKLGEVIPVEGESIESPVSKEPLPDNYGVWMESCLSNSRRRSRHSRRRRLFC